MNTAAINKIPLIIYHANCLDGFTAAWIVNNYWKCKVDLVAASYGDCPPDVTDRTVIIVDFSYPRAEILNMAESANSILLLDHHKTALENLGDPDILMKDSQYKILANLDMTRSGAMLAWNCYHPQQPDQEAPLLVRYVQDRDLWQFNLCDTKVVMAAVASYEQNFEIWDALADNCKIGRLATEGVALLRQHKKLVVDILATTTRKITIDGCVGLSSNCNYQFASDVGSKLAAISGTFGATWFTKSDGDVQFSLRSIGDYDVSAIAKLFGGGGHKNAAGFSLHTPIESDSITLWSRAPVDFSDMDDCATKEKSNG